MAIRPFSGIRQAFAHKESASGVPVRHCDGVPQALRTRRGSQRLEEIRGDEGGAPPRRIVNQSDDKLHAYALCFDRASTRHQRCHGRTTRWPGFRPPLPLRARVARRRWLAERRARPAGSHHLFADRLAVPPSGWILRPGNDFYVVYTHNWMDDLTQNRTYTLDRRAATKVSYTKRFRTTTTVR